MRAPHGWQQISAFYGWDRFRGDLRDWESRMVIVKAPPGVSFYFDRDEDGARDDGEGSRGIRVHPACADQLVGVLLEVKATGLWRFIESCAGGYAWRPQRGSSKLSMHALGAAVDFDALRNPLGVDPRATALGTEPGLGVVRIFERHGWTWGGRWGRPDAMHCQFGSGH